MPAFRDLTGEKIGYWTVISLAFTNGRYTAWNCKCQCGTERIVRAAHLGSGASRSCGCGPIQVSSHGEARNTGFTKKYRTWRYIRSRCLDPKHKNANIYHGLLCEEWKDYNNFNRDVPDPLDDSLSIDRIDNSKGYEPGNVRWVTMAEQHRNQSNCRFIEYNGKTQLMIDWARELEIPYDTLLGRLNRYSPEIAFAPNFIDIVRRKISMPVIIDEVCFESIKEASNKLDIYQSSIKHRCLSEKFPNYRILEKKVNNEK